MQVTITFDPSNPEEVRAAQTAVAHVAFCGDAYEEPTKPAEKPKAEEAAAAAKAKEAALKAKQEEQARLDAEKAKAIAAAEAEAEAVAKAEAGTESSAMEDEADPLADEAPVEEEATQADVLAALKDYREIEGTDAVISVLKEHGATHIKDLDPAKYAAVLKAVK